MHRRLSLTMLLLESVNGLPLPFVLQSANPRVEVMSDQLVISETGTFAETFAVRRTMGTDVTTENGTAKGTYELDGTTVRLPYTDGSTGRGVTTGNNLTLSGDGFSPAYVRQ